MRKRYAFLLASMFSFGAFAQTYNMQSGTTSIQGCGGIFQDDGGSAAGYSSGFNGTTTFYPTVIGSKVQLTFTYFETENYWDELSVYDGNSTTAPEIIMAHSGSSLPNGGAVIESTAADGSLTVTFTSDGSVTYGGWSATLGCSATSLPACSGPVTDIVAGISSGSGSVGSTIYLTSSGLANADLSLQWQSAPSENGPWSNIAGETSYIANVTASNDVTTTYYRLEITCIASSDVTYSTVVSYETLLVFFMSNGNNSYTTCEGVFYDNGGVDGNYSNSQDGTITFYPSTPGASVQLTFTVFDLEDCCDYFSVFNGPNENSPVIVFEHNGTSFPNGGQPIQSTAADGSLTIKFTSDGSVNRMGWVAAITCVQECSGPVTDLVAQLSPSTGIVGANFVAGIGTPTTANVGYQWEFATDETGPWSDVQGATDYLSTIAAPLTTGTFYYRLRATCLGSNDVTYSTVGSFTTQPGTIMEEGLNVVSICDGIFVDNGTVGNYTDGFTGITTFMPLTVGQAVSLTFLEFELEDCCDYLSIFDGSTTNAPVLVNQVNGMNTPNGGLPIVSSALDGSLTVRFTSDGSANFPGWSALIGCVVNPNPLCDASIEAGTITLSGHAGGAGAVFTGTTTGNTQEAGITSQWEVASSPTGPWTAIQGAITTTETFTAPNDFGYTYYRLVSTCVSSGVQSISNMEYFRTVEQTVLMPTSGATQVTTCASVFYDSGSNSSNYQNNESGVITFTPEQGMTIQLNFLNFVTENTWDYLTIYDGNSTSAPEVDSYTGDALPNGGQSIISTAVDGSLTVEFYSDGSATRVGWEAMVSCYCPNMTETVNMTICEGELPLSFQNLVIQEGGAYVNATDNNGGCENVTYLNLTVNPSPSVTETITACSDYFWSYTGSTYTESGVFTVAIPNEEGCDSVRVLDLTLSISDLTLAYNAGTLTANQTGATYQWLDCSNNFAEIQGETNQTYEPSQSGLYSCRITIDGCTANTNCLTVQVVSVDDIEAVKWNVFPNPSNGVFNISTDAMISNAKVEVYSAVGQLVHSTTIDGTQVSVDLSNQPNGVYIVKVNNQKNLRLVKTN